MFNFVFERCVLGRPYPNLAPLIDARYGYQDLGNQYPRIAPCRLLYYCEDHTYPYSINYIGQDLPHNSWYPVGLAWFDFSLDYFAMMSESVLSLLKQKQLRVLFYYHEGDSPVLEKQWLDQLCQAHNLPLDCYAFVSGNTVADQLSNFVYFPDHELFYWRTQKTTCEIHSRPRQKQFTALSRIHKWWRLTVMSSMHHQGLLNNSYWSYGTTSIGDQYHDNPIELCRFQDLEKHMDQLWSTAPHTCDTLTSDQHNQHSNLVQEHFENSYCHLVIETLYDAEQSQGAFITEKTFKPICHGQPFVIFGTPFSLATLKKLGYRTFDHVIDTGYDFEINNTERFIKTLDTVQKLSQCDLHSLYQQCIDDLNHNQQLFLSSKHNRLEQLANQLNS